ncbi:MAG: DNA mismatch repair endonuclease MutL [Candidatus Omnitrophica bacterium]|nr:DNA mismatch repair endonuclease MutL [Candidatus Omnitrophota bacterium]
MGNVHILPPEIISKIAAGEVIERPASAVKELMENSLDAGTSLIELHVKHAGKTQIKLRDSGSGINREDLEKLFLRHATSKISRLDDLYRIGSLGFRGEALYSIAAVSDITLRSKTKEQDNGWEIHVRGGERLSLKPVSFPDGTEVEVNELFFNTPARKKFMKTNTTELNRIIDIFTSYALIYPDIRFFLAHNDNPVFDLPAGGDRIKRIAKTLNLDPGHILETKKEFPEDQLRVHLFLGDINIQRPSKDTQFIFINDRPVQSRSLSFHLNRIYRLIMPEGTNPFFIVHVHLPPEDVDVNVHPAKREVKIKNEASLISLLRPLCEETLMSFGKAKLAHETIFSAPQIEKLYSPPAARDTSPSAVREPLQKPYLHRMHEDQTFDFSNRLPAPFQQKALKEKLSGCRYIGTLSNKYLLLESPGSLLIADQHAAHERVNYEKFKKQAANGKIEIEQLLTPVLIGLNRQELLVWEEIKDKLEILGLSTTSWDKETIALHAHPRLITRPETAVRNILSGIDTPACDMDTLIRRACRRSIMFGDKTQKEQAEFIRVELLKCEDPFICPHGRPTVVEIPETYISKQFLR